MLVGTIFFKVRKNAIYQDFVDKEKPSETLKDCLFTSIARILTIYSSTITLKV